jgi:hypothetical protein
VTLAMVDDSEAARGGSNLGLHPLERGRILPKLMTTGPLKDVAEVCPYEPGIIIILLNEIGDLNAFNDDSNVPVLDPHHNLL